MSFAHNSFILVYVISLKGKGIESKSSRRRKRKRRWEQCDGPTFSPIDYLRTIGVTATGLVLAAGGFSDVKQEANAKTQRKEFAAKETLASCKKKPTARPPQNIKGTADDFHPRRVSISHPVMLQTTIKMHSISNYNRPPAASITTYLTPPTTPPTLII